MSPSNEPEFLRIQSSVPLFSGIGYECAYITGFGWGFTFQIICFLLEINIDIFQWLIVTLSVGFLSQYVYFILKRKRFRNPVENSNILALFDEVKQTLGKGQDVELWFRDTDRSIFLSDANILFQAILLSESTIADILNKPESGKVILAKEILVMKRVNAQIRIIIGALIFSMFSFIESMFSFDIFAMMIFSFGLVMLAVILIGALLGVVLILYLAIRKNEDIDKIIERLFDFPAGAAMVEVFSGFTVPEEVIFKAKQDEEEGKPTESKKAMKKASIAAVLAFTISFVIFYFIIMNDFTLKMIFSVIMAAVIAFGAFMITIMTSMMMPMLRPGKRDTKWDAHVPFASDLQSFLRKFERLESIEVRGVKPPSEEMYGLVILRLNDKFEEEVLEAMFPSTLKDIHDVELAGPYLLSEIRRQEIEKKHTRISWAFLGIAIPFLVIGLIYTLFTMDFYQFFGVFFQIMIIYLIIAIVPAIVMSYLKRRDEIRSDAEIANTCPRFREALEILIAKHHTLPYGKTSYRTRLERINKHLGLESNTEFP